VIIPKDKIKDWIFDFNKTDDLLFHEQPGLLKKAAE